MIKLLKVTSLICLLLHVSSLHFDLSRENKRCYLEELFDHSVAVIKYKIWTNTTNEDKCKH